MNDCRVKICGITRPDDARAAVRLRADYLGVIFAESPRRVTVDGARAIRDAAPEARLVGVFVDAPVDEVARTADACDLDLVQLHGDESPRMCAEVSHRTGRPVIKAMRWGNIPDAAVLGSYETTSYFLFDLGRSATLAEARATHAALWEHAAQARSLGFRVFLAGALTPETVRDAVARTNVFCVDVCRGVESAPGVKDLDAMARFIEAVKS